MSVILLRIKKNKFTNRVISFLLLSLAAFGYFFTYYKYARPRGFKGDFYAAMYDASWWDGQGIIYGPIFVFERWFVNSFPEVASVYFFAWTCLILIAATFLIVIVTVKARDAFLVFCILVWSLNSFFYYSYSVAANPELLELFLIVVVWWGLSTSRFKLSYFILACAILTKIVPIIFAPILLFFFSWSAIFLSLSTVIGVYLIVSIGQKQSFFESLLQTFAVNPVPPQPTSEQFLGLNSAISRLVGASDIKYFQAIETFSIVSIILLYLCAIAILFKLYQLKNMIAHQYIVAYAFALFMAFMPLMHLGQTHRHTFLFLAPVFIAMKYLVNQDKHLKYSKLAEVTIYALFFAYSLLPLYALDVFNYDNFLGVRFGKELQSSIVMVSEPIWINLIIIVLVLTYGLQIIKSQGQKK